MKNIIIIDEMFVVVAELQGDIDSMQMNPTYEAQLGEIELIEKYSFNLYSELASYYETATTFEFDVWITVIKNSNYLQMMESVITDIRNEELYLLFTHISQLNTLIKLLK